MPEKEDKISFSYMLVLQKVTQGPTTQPCKIFKCLGIFRDSSASSAALKIWLLISRCLNFPTFPNFVSDHAGLNVPKSMELK